MRSNEIEKILNELTRLTKFIIYLQIKLQWLGTIY